MVGATNLHMGLPPTNQRPCLAHNKNPLFSGLVGARGFACPSMGITPTKKKSAFQRICRGERI